MLKSAASDSCGSPHTALCAQAQRRIHCPTCRTRTLVADIAYVDAGRAPAEGGGGGSNAAAAADEAAAEEAEEGIVVRGSYGTKARPPSAFTCLVQSPGSRSFDKPDD